MSQSWGPGYMLITKQPIPRSWLISCSGSLISDEHQIRNVYVCISCTQYILHKMGKIIKIIWLDIFYFIPEKTKAQRGKLTCPKSHISTYCHHLYKCFSLWVQGLWFIHFEPSAQYRICGKCSIKF